MPLPKDNLFFGFANKLSQEQRKYADAIFDNQAVFVNAPSGSGKTTIAVACAKLLKKDLLYIFSPVEEKALGYTPGTVEDKEFKYIQPLIDALMEIDEDPQKVIYREDNIDNIKKGNVWVYPKSHIFARGTNIKNKTVILDEAQNFTVPELKKVLTRIHNDCKLIVIGHSGQCDLDKPQKSGFQKYIDHFKDEPYVEVCHLEKNYRGALARKADELKGE